MINGIVYIFSNKRTFKVTIHCIYNNSKRFIGQFYTVKSCNNGCSNWLSLHLLKSTCLGLPSSSVIDKSSSCFLGLAGNEHLLKSK